MRLLKFFNINLLLLLFFFTFLNTIVKSEEEKIKSVISELYYPKKDHLKQFVKDSMKELWKDEYPGDLIISNILNDILRDDQLCKRTLINEIDLYQKNNLSKQ